MTTRAELLRGGAAEFGIELDPHRITQFERYLELLEAGNDRMNLTAVPPEQYVTRHLLDSLAAAPYLAANHQRLVDVGTGAGLPGIPLAILYPNRSFLLLDSLKKRIGFLDEVISEIGLTNAATRHIRAEDAGHAPDLRQQFDAALSRAVAALPILAELCVPLISIGGSFIALKGDAVAEESAAANEAFKTLGAAAPQIHTVQTTCLGAPRTIVTAEKIAATPAQYPRAPKAIERKALGAHR